MSTESVRIDGASALVTCALAASDVRSPSGSPSCFGCRLFIVYDPESAGIAGPHRGLREAKPVVVPFIPCFSP